jgi:CRP-like cAMP-binding protein
MDLLTLMRQVELFRGLTAEQIEKLGGIFASEHFSKGAEIFAQGDSGDKMYIIGRGQVEVSVQSSDGQAHAMVYLGRGQVVGEMALIDSGRRSASVFAADDDTVVYSVPTDKFTGLCRENTAIGYVMMRNLAQDLSFKLRHRDFDPSQS